MKRRPEPDEAQRLLKVAIIGAPNAGKSTLLNKLLSWKVCLLPSVVGHVIVNLVWHLWACESLQVYLDGTRYRLTGPVLG